MPTALMRHIIAASTIVVIIAGATVLAMLSSSARIHPAWIPGHQLLYRFAYRGEAVYRLEALFSQQALTKPPQHVYTAVSGTLIETAVEHDARGATVLWNVIEPQVHYVGGTAVDPIYQAQLRSDLQLPFATRLTNDGRIGSVVGSPQASQLGIQFMRATLSRIQIVAPATPSLFGRTWEVSEPDADGSRASSYNLDRWISGSFEGATVGFTRATSLTVLHPTAQLIHRPDILGAGADRGVWRLDGSLNSLKSTDARNTYYGQTLIARSQSVLALELFASATLDDKKLAAARAYAEEQLRSSRATALHVEPSNADVARTAFTNALATDNEDSLAAQLIDATRRHDHTNVSTLAQKFAALFYFRPQAIVDFEPVLRRARSDSIPFDVLAAAFQEADTPPAQSALAEVAENRAREPHAGESLAITLGFLQHPTPRVDAALEYIADHGEPDAADSAELALGSTAGALAGVDNERATAIVERISHRLAVANDDYARENELLALGNAHSAASVEAIVLFQGDASSDVRSAAATALRSIDDPMADSALRKLLHDPAPEVRIASSAAFEHRSLSTESFDALLAMLRSDPDAEVRAQALDAVWNSRSAFPAAAAAVRAALHDPDKRVRSAAQFAMAAPQGEEERPVPPDLPWLSSQSANKD